MAIEITETGSRASMTLAEYIARVAMYAGPLPEMSWAREMAEDGYWDRKTVNDIAVAISRDRACMMADRGV